MQRPQGFDRGLSRPAEATARPRKPGARSSRSRDATREGETGKQQDAAAASPGPTQRPTDPITEPLPIIGAGGTARPSKRDGRTDAAAGANDTAESIPSPGRASRLRRRYERNEVKRFTRRSRRRRAIWLGSIATVVVVLAITVLAAFSPLMSVRTIQVVGTTRVDAAAVRHSLSSQLGKPLPLVDYGVIRKELDSYHLIRSYSTEAVPPGTLVVRVVERTPIGLLKTASGYDLVDQAGVVISSTAQKPGGYPVITTAGAAGSTAAKESFAASAAVLGVLPETLLPKISAITATSAENVTFTLNGRSVTWGGSEDATLKATVLAALLKAAPKAHAYDVSSPHAPVIR